jgi:hypothetical protein
MTNPNSPEMKVHRASCGPEVERIMEIRDNAQEIACREAGEIARHAAVVAGLDLFKAAAIRYIRDALPSPRSSLQNAADRSDAYSYVRWMAGEALAAIRFHHEEPTDDEIKAALQDGPKP